MTESGSLLDALAGAISAGALLSASECSNSAVHTAYHRLRDRIRGLLALSSDDGREWFDRFEIEPKIWRDPLAETLDESDIAGDPDVMRMLIRLGRVLAENLPAIITLPLDAPVSAPAVVSAQSVMPSAGQ
jgi:hypothetical protein